MKKKYAESVGIKMDVYHFENRVQEKEIINRIGGLSENGIIVELPLPKHLNRDKILDSIPKEKDIDVLSLSAQEDFYNNQQSSPGVGDSPLRTPKIDPPSVGALKILFEEYKINPKNKVAAVFGQSILIGKPISHWLENMGAKVFKIDENTENPKELCLKADIVISGVGKTGLISGDIIKDGSVVVDFGFVPIFPNLKNLRKIEDPRFANRVSREANREKIRIVGDVDFGSVAPKSSLITPVPGGMGPILIASFLENVSKLYLSSAR